MAPLNCTIPIHIVYKGIQATTPFVLAYGRRLKKKKSGVNDATHNPEKIQIHLHALRHQRRPIG